MTKADDVMMTILDAAEEHGAERVLRELVDAGIIELTGVDENGQITYSLVRDK